MYVRVFVGCFCCFVCCCVYCIVGVIILDRFIVSMCLIDHEIDNLVSLKKMIDNRLVELYASREDLYVEYENLNKKIVEEEML